ncbi:NAD(P)/FAD-dependent oxidoreductase [Planctomonas psychrotolerans]|uniref:NAD(P)/FAD-dependent oxidoreductase n=1 Tax=Planctomonas psychrotolerans TaxID=2528712 RepID=UPI00123A9654|nr:NAD(P)/FAD-dependent oxidoreductase [Planctomonas psychrotolerans]
MATRSKHVLILGGGYVGLYTAWELQKHASSAGLRITVVEPNPYMTYQPLLPEVAGGQVEPRNVTVQLRRALRKSNVLRGELESLDVDAKTASVRDLQGTTRRLDYDHVVIATGSVSRTFPTPGLAENAVGFKTLEEAVYVRDRVLDNIALAAASTDADERAKALTFVFIGGGYTGVEALGELNDLAKITVDAYPEVDRSDLRWVLIEALDRVAPEVGPSLSRYTLGKLRDRGIDVRFETTVTSCVDGDVVLSTGETIPANTIVWTAGVKPNPVLDATNAPRGPKGHVNVNPYLQVAHEDGTIVDGAWAAGDNAQVPDLTAETQPAYCPPNAQHALRQAKRLAKNIAAVLEGREIEEYRHASLGTVASYGFGKGAANIKGLKLRGALAWLAHRAYHGMAMPTVNRKIRVFAGWATGVVLPRDITPMSAHEHPRDAFMRNVAANDRK